MYFHLPDLTVLNSWILLSSCGVKYTDTDFRLLLVRNLIEEAAKSQDLPTLILFVRPSVGAKNVLLLESRHNQTVASKIINPNALPSVFVTAKEVAQCINAPDVMWACLRCIVLWNITPK